MSEYWSCIEILHWQDFHNIGCIYIESYELAYESKIQTQQTLTYPNKRHLIWDTRSNWVDIFLSKMLLIHKEFRNTITCVLIFFF